MTAIQRNKDIKPFYTSRELAGLLNVSDRVVLNYHSSGYMNFPRGIKVGSQWRWNPKDIDTWIESYKTAQAEAPKHQKATTHKSEGKVVKIEIEPRNLEDFAQEMYDLLCRIAHACKGEEVSGINDFLHDIIRAVSEEG